VHSLRIVPVRARADVLAHDVAKRCIRSVAGLSRFTERRPCWSHRPRMSIIAMSGHARASQATFYIADLHA